MMTAAMLAEATAAREEAEATAAEAVAEAAAVAEEEGEYPLPYTRRAFDSYSWFL